MGAAKKNTTMETKLYRIKQYFAKDKNIPIYFVANKIMETPRAIYLYGRGTTETAKMGRCCACGRTLTHPVSIELGIGPECGQHFHNWDLIGGYNKENIERLKGALISIKVDTWLPKSSIVEILPTEDMVTTPKDHPILKKQEESKQEQKQPENTPEMKPLPSTTTTIHTKLPERRAEKVFFTKTGDAAIKITFPFNHNDLDRVKTLSGRRFHNEGLDKYWTVPFTMESLKKLQSWNFSLDEALQKNFEKSLIPTVDVKDLKNITIPGLKGDLFPYQNKGVSFAESKDGRALIADEMGLGKTVQALAWLQLRPEQRPAIITVPASLKFNWMKEAINWMDHPRVQILSGTNTNTPIIGEVIIINYDILPNWVDVLLSLNPKVLITDECHYYKNDQAQRTKAVMKLGKKIPHILALSGTPIVNRPVEFYNAIKLVDSTLFPNRWSYLQRYCGAKHNGFGWDFNGATNTAELHQILKSTIMIRRLKSEVLTELPDKMYSYIPFELSNERQYRKAEYDFIEFLRETKGNQVANRAESAKALVEIEGLKQLCVQGKMEQTIEWIRNFLENNGKLVLFAVHKATIDTLMAEFKDIAVKIDGSVSMTDRDNAVTEFQTNDKIKLFVGNIKAAGVGLTLTAASNVAILELPWTPGELSQAIDRVHRIGQKNAVMVWYLLAANTIEEKLAAILDTKRGILDSILDGQAPEESSLITELMNSFNNH